MISLVRIDDRLIHGQVVTQWVSRVKANKIIVVDDGVAKDPFYDDCVQKPCTKRYGCRGVLC